MYTYQHKAFPFRYSALDDSLAVCPQKPSRLELRPWQYVVMQYHRVGLQAPLNIPDFDSLEDADIWMCLDMQYNRRMRELSHSYDCQTAG